MNYVSARFLYLASLLTLITLSCGKKSNDGSNNPPYLQALVQGSDAMGYGINLLASSNKTSPSDSTPARLLNDEETFTPAASIQDPALPDCSKNGEPWDTSTNLPMQASHSRYSQTVFYCQVNSKQSPDTVAGSLNQYKAILCDVERVIGSIIYSAEGTEYNDRSVSITEACGWSSKSLEDMAGTAMTVNLKAYSIDTGDWQKRVQVSVPAQKLNFDLYFTIKNDLIGFKFIESWSQVDRLSGSDFNSNISSSAVGTRGALITVDPVNGILRAESIDTYWSRRFRFFIDGELDSTSGLLTTITDGQGIVANFDHQTGLYADIATMVGGDSGFYHGAYKYTTSNVSTVRTSSTVAAATPSCSVSGGCQGLSVIGFSNQSTDFDFLMIGAAWDNQSGKRQNAQSWLTGAAALTFTKVDKSITL